MQHGHTLKKLNFRLCPIPSAHPGGRTQAFKLKSCLICFIFIVPLSACAISVKIFTTDRVTAKFKYLTFHHTSGGWCKILITVLLIYRHWVIMAYSEKLSDIIIFEKCEVYYTKKANIDFALA